MKLFVKALVLIVGLVFSNLAAAVGMGGISVTSALGEPLKAEIELTDVSKADKNRLSARMATPDDFKGAGLDYPSSLPRLKFQIGTRANGDSYVELTSAQPVNDPFVNLLVELNWSSGRLLREYTFLLDPPGFKPQQPKEDVRPVLSKSEELHEPATAAASAVKAMKEVKTEPLPLKTEPLRTAPPPAAPAPAKPAAQGGNVASGAITVKRGDTLSKIARETRSADVSLERMLVAMYRANEDEFDGHNMNRLRVGKILRVPVNDEVAKVEQTEAVQEIRAQAADWHAYRLKLAAASTAVEHGGPRQEVSGKISGTVADQTPPARQTATDVVRLSKGEAPGDRAGGGKVQALQDKLHSMEEEAIARNKQLKDSNARIAMLEKNIKEMQRLLELKGQPVPPAAPEPSKPSKPESKPEVSPVPVAAPVVAPAASAPAPAPAPAPKPKVKRVPAPPPPPPSLLDEILGEPLYLAGGAAVLLGLGGAGFMLARRRGKGGKTVAGAQDVDAGATHISAPASPADTGDFTQSVSPFQAAQAAVEDVDPVSEADLFLNFGRDVQAEEILKDALKKTPDNQQIRLKLLSIYASRRDAKTFAAVATQVKDSGDEAAWAQAAEMGHKLEPGNPLYGGDGSAVGEAAPALEQTHGGPANLDFDLGLGESGADAHEPRMDSTIMLDVPLDETAPAGLDFDLGLGATAVAAPAVAAAAEEKGLDTTSALDFDLGLDEPAEAAKVSAPAASAASMDFDVTAEHLGLAPKQEEAAPAAAEAEVPSLEDLVFDVTASDLAPALAQESAAAAAPEQASAADEFTLDFPTTKEEPATAKEEPVAAKQASAVDFGDIDLNMGTPAPAPAPGPQEEIKDAHWHDVATKLDLARAYQEMGDASGAREILDEVLAEGDEQQRAAATAMIQQLPA